MLIIVHSEEEKKQWLEASRHIHGADVDIDMPAVNLIAHLYLAPYLIEVRPRATKETAPSAFVMPKLPGLCDNHSLRLVIPGVDGGHAVHLEGEVLHESVETCEELLKRVIVELPKTEFRETE